MPATATKCGGCGQTFDCGVSTSRCWCMQYPAFLPVIAGGSCFCPSCLPKAIGAAITERLEKISLKEALKLARQYPLEDGKDLVEHIDYSIENGFFVFSRWYHLRRGNCCGNGCRHCPYGQAA